MLYAKEFFALILILSLAGCGTRIASPYDSISDEILTETFLLLKKTKRAAVETKDVCSRDWVIEGFSRAATNTEVLIARYRSRDFETQAAQLETLLVLLNSASSIRATVSRSHSIVEVCSTAFWDSVDRIFQNVWEFEQGKRSSRFEFF